MGDKVFFGLEIIAWKVFIWKVKTWQNRLKIHVNVAFSLNFEIFIIKNKKWCLYVVLHIMHAGIILLSENISCPVKGLKFTSESLIYVNIYLS